MAKHFFVVTETHATVLTADMKMLATMTKVVQLFFARVFGDDAGHALWNVMNG